MFSSLFCLYVSILCLYSVSAMPLFCVSGLALLSNPISTLLYPVSFLSFSYALLYSFVSVPCTFSVFLSTSHSVSPLTVSSLYNISILHACLYPALQMKGWRESNINVWFRFMYSQKWNCAVSLFSKQNYNVLSPNFHIHESVSDLYIPRIGPHILQQPNRQTDPGNI